MAIPGHSQAMRPAGIESKENRFADHARGPSRVIPPIHLNARVSVADRTR